MTHARQMGRHPSIQKNIYDAQKANVEPTAINTEDMTHARRISASYLQHTQFVTFVSMFHTENSNEEKLENLGGTYR